MSNFVITIARAYGSGGKTIGKMLAKELGFSYYDKEIPILASIDSGINEKLFGRADERLKGGLFKKPVNVYQDNKLIPPQSGDFVSDDNLFNYQAKVIKELAQKESCVFVGRCADFVLKDMENMVRVFVYASPEACVRNVTDMYGLSEKEAKKVIEKPTGSVPLTISIIPAETGTTRAIMIWCLTAASWGLKNARVS